MSQGVKVSNGTETPQGVAQGTGVKARLGVKTSRRGMMDHASPSHGASAAHTQHAEATTT